MIDKNDNDVNMNNNNSSGVNYMAGGIGGASMVNCPRCGSNKTIIAKRGYSCLNGCLFGLIFGLLGANKLMINCLNCGYKGNAVQNKKRELTEQEKQKLKRDMLTIIILILVIIILNIIK